MIPKEDLNDVTLVIEDGTCLLTKVVHGLKLSVDESCLSINVVY